jgi:hypothetical protein
VYACTHSFLSIYDLCTYIHICTHTLTCIYVYIRLYVDKRVTVLSYQGSIDMYVYIDLCAYV